MNAKTFYEIWKLMQTQTTSDCTETLPSDNTKRTQSHTHIVKTKAHIQCTLQRIVPAMADHNKLTSQHNSNAARANEQNSLFHILRTDLIKCSCECSKEFKRNMNVRVAIY